MNNDLNKSKVINSLFWKLMERGGTQGLQFVVQIILARLLEPEQYGIISIITVFIAIANVFVQSGFNTALIQKKEVNETDYSSVFYLSLAISVVLYISLFFTAPLIADFYSMAQLVPVIRVLSITLIIGTITSIQNAVISRNMEFRKLFTSSLGATLISAVVGITMAYSGYGVWALVAQQLTNQIAITFILWVTVDWRPKLLFSFKRVKVLFSFSSKLLISQLLDTLYNNLRNLIIGRLYAPVILGYYNRGEQFPSLIVTNVDSSIQSVMLPALSSQQDNRKRMKDMMRRSIVTSSFLVFPMMIGLAVIAKPMVSIILTDKWLPSVPYIQIFSLSYALRPIHTSNLQAINALGRSDIFLRLEIVKKTMGIIVLAISVNYGVYAIALGAILTSVISSFINAYPNRALLDYSYLDQVKDIMPSFLLALSMGVFIYGVQFLDIPVPLVLILQIFAGTVFYFGVAKLLKMETYEYLFKTIKEVLSKRKTMKNAM
ncbi:lipopolysaccharide biosynthesis protein [Jeotgalibaca sp. A122]|uniref:lipopolysaccharide biosynthesis protein n=1 Tax=Jeotgalibaca sp. A122 TaxID=3457322 RepID=UPI003FD45639